MSKDLKISLLLDFYGDMLNQKQRDVIDDYYNSDLSLSEIAADKGISRQGIRDSIKRSENQLIEMEEKLKLYEKFKDVNEKLSYIIELSGTVKTESEDKKIAEIAAEIIETAQKLID